MFISKLRPIAIPQSEHQKLAGTLALLWGNAKYERPAVPIASFLTGIGLHDRAYGPLDNLPIGELAQDEWLALTRKGFDMKWADPLADVIAKMHLQRLASYGKSPARQAEASVMAEIIAALVAQYGLDAALLARIDRITDLCDSIAFDFCFETPAQGAMYVLPRNNGGEEVEMRYWVGEGTIRVDPWPFSVEGYRGYLVGYQLEGYPEVLEPVLVTYELAGAVERGDSDTG
jgi:hypothetical protein